MRERLEVAGQLVRLVLAGRRWWLVPVLIGLVFVGTLALIGSASPLSPFLYPLF